ncbi:transposable element tc3 transposase [Gigaspora margarita]|uniref:Transposable element tc3 transposase n=1 Tax=Gigaspora margarita TaxID=4874 RepID=A0A8H4ASU5_GIGMA|nr:transposable element tc3 transposase [Gigaspora margarita]
MTSFEEKHILVKFLWGHSYNEVPKLQKIARYPKKTLYRWTTQLTETSDIKLGEHTGHPQLLGPEQKKYFDKIVKQDRTVTSINLIEVLNNIYSGLNIASRMVRENLTTFSYQVTVPYTVPLLKKEAILYHVSWACKYQRRR